jgi:hypothetical protein
MVMAVGHERRRLALAGKLDLAPAYVVMAFTLFLSYASSMAYNHLYTGWGFTVLSDFGVRHFPSVRGAANLSNDARACAFVMTIQWFLGVMYFLVFCIFLSPFSRSVKVAVDKAVHKARARQDEDRSEFGRIAFLILVPIVFLGDLRLVSIPTFFNGGLFAVKGGEALLVYIINSSVFMPAFSWLVVFATFLFYWSWIHMIANYKIIFNI